MVLTKRDSERYFTIRDALLTHGSPKGRAAENRPGTRVTSSVRVPTVEVLWPDSAAIDSFVAQNPARLNARDLRLAASWKRSVSGNFFTVRYLKTYTIIITEVAPYRIYAVVGHQSPLSAVFGPVLPDLFSLRLI